MQFKNALLLASFLAPFLVSAAPAKRAVDDTTPTFTEDPPYTPEPRPSCGPCLNDCLVRCTDLRLCRCAYFCDPKYVCKKETTTVKIPGTPILTVPVKNPRDVTTSRDPVATLSTEIATKVPAPSAEPTRVSSISSATFTRVPLPSTVTLTTRIPFPTPTCGCTNSCWIACGTKGNCICPAYCDPVYLCKDDATLVTSRVPVLEKRQGNIVITRTAPVVSVSFTTLPIKTSIKPLPSIITSKLPQPTKIPCGTCTNDCVIACKGKADCACPLYCDPKYYACKA